MAEQPAVDQPEPTPPPSSGLRGRKIGRFSVWVLLIWVVLIGFLVMIGLGLLRTQEGQVGVGSMAPQFTLTTFDGKTINTNDLRGQVVVVNFWASWCKPCEQEASELQQAYQDYKGQGVVFIGVNYVDTAPEALDYLNRYSITYPNGPDLGTRVSQAYRIRGVPETYVMGPNGKLTGVMIGPYPSLQAIESSIQQAMMTGS